MTMDNENEKRINEKLQFFYEEKIEVNVEKKDRSFWNGILVKPKGPNVWIMQEKKVGEVFLFVSDIYDVDEFKEVGR